jgi:hypothetical protein
MALNVGLLANELQSAIEGNTGNPMPAIARDVWDAVAEVIVEHIRNNAQVVVASVSGVTPGGGASGPGTGTIL